MEKLVFIDYYGNCDANGKSVGHSPKVLMEYLELFRETYQLGAILPQCIVNEIDKQLFQRVYQLPYQIVEEGNRSVRKRFFDKFKLFFNISKALHKADGDILFFYRTDFFLFLYFVLHQKPKRKKMVCLVYQQKFAGGALGKALNWIYQLGLKKFDGVIYTQKGTKPKHRKICYLPDYYYDRDIYHKYIPAQKEEKVVCLGTMSPYKKLEELVEVFNKTGKSLEIIGRFFDKERVEKLKKSAKGNILIRDTILNTEEYYERLARAQYTILPYDMQQYTGRTSGILVEALFVQTAPIAPIDLLKENGVEGIGYISLQELSNSEFLEENKSRIHKILRDELQKYPTKQDVKNCILQFIEQI